MARKANKTNTIDPATASFELGRQMLYAHPLFEPFSHYTHIVRDESSQCPRDGWALVTSHGTIHVHPTRRCAPEEWAYVLAHCLLHLGFGHAVAQPRPREWNAACDCFIAPFLATLRLGRPPVELRTQAERSAATEQRVYDTFCERSIPAECAALSTAGPHASDMVYTNKGWTPKPDLWQKCLAEGLAQAVTSAVEVAAGRAPTLGAAPKNVTPAQTARSWFISSYPLLGSLAATFKIIEDPAICYRLGITVAAVGAESQEIFINPGAALTPQQLRFVMAHELLHVGLRHEARCQGRDPYLWNVAADYVINGWLVEMGVGELPQIGGLYDPALVGESAESIYDRIVTDMRRYRKLATLRGVGASDILARGQPEWWNLGNGVSLDEFYRRCLSQGLLYHEDQGRGLLPAGLIEEIEALSQPPIPWDVELARWFDHCFPPPEQVRTYARLSRHQSATPDIPRPRWMPAPDWEEGRTFGVLLDTSGSMDRVLLAKALGAIASYSVAHEVPAVRVVFCDAAIYDQGYMPPEDIAGSVKVRGRGGTILQPGVELLEQAEDFPPDGPLLIITDGWCDTLRITRTHAFLVPEGRRLPFVPRGEVFYMK